MSRTQQSARPRATPPPDVRAEAWRVALLVRELRRAAASQRFRLHLYGAAELLDPGQHDALDAAVELGPVRMHELASRLRVDRSTATRTIERLENLGLVERRSDPYDGRYVVVAVTRAGRRRHRALADLARRAMDDLFEPFDDHQLAVFGDLLEQFVGRIDELIVDD